MQALRLHAAWREGVGTCDGSGAPPVLAAGQGAIRAAVSSGSACCWPPWHVRPELGLPLKLLLVVEDGNKHMCSRASRVANQMRPAYSKVRQFVLAGLHKLAFCVAAGVRALGRPTTRRVISRQQAQKLPAVQQSAQAQKQQQPSMAAKQASQPCSAPPPK